MNNEESLAALCFNRGCSNLGVLSPVYEVMSNFLSNEAKVLTFDQEKSRLRKDDFVYVRDHHEKLLREKSVIGNSTICTYLDKIEATSSDVFILIKLPQQ